MLGTGEGTALTRAATDERRRHAMMRTPVRLLTSYPPKHMGISIEVGNVSDEIGSASFFHAFCSTISAHLEPDGWGSRFPLLLRHLYQGELSAEHAARALDELRRARAELSQLPPSHVVWDVEDRSARPPWGDEISSEITSLGNYFVSSTGRDLFDLLHEALRSSSESGEPARIV